MLNAGSLLNKTEELADLAQQKNLDIIGVPETWLHDGIRDDEICIPGYILFRQDRPSQKKGGGVILYVESNLLPQRVVLPPTTPSSLYVSLIVCDLLFNTEPSTIAVGLTTLC